MGIVITKTAYGKSKTDGTWERCRAKPENRGKGRCPHGEHQDLTKDEEQIIHVLNDEILIKKYGSTARLSKKGDAPSSTGKRTQQSGQASSKPRRKRRGQGSRRNKIAKVGNNSFATHEGGRSLTRKEFDTSSQKVAESFPQEDWKAINSFYSKFSEVSEKDEAKKNFDSAVKSVKEYMKSDDPDAVKMREFFGDDVNVDDVAEILVYQVNAMRSPITWETKRPGTIKRSIATTVNNDMNKERYVASVMFFGGRCCYCNQPMSKREGDSKATGEHITPVNPSGNGVMGGTRYGNMALACSGCNNERGNKELNEWISETSRLSEENKKASMDRIDQFRKFALYKEYTPEQSNAIRAAIKETEKFMYERRNPNGSYVDNGIKEIRDHLKITIHDLNEMLR